jgi:hypothetical protein
MRLMTGNALEVHLAMIRFIVKGPRARLRLSSIGMTFETGAVAQWKTQMIGLFEVA